IRACRWRGPRCGGPFEILAGVKLVFLDRDCNCAHDASLLLAKCFDAAQQGVAEAGAPAPQNYKSDDYGFSLFFTVLPTGLLLRVFGKDVLRLKWDREAKTYWIARSDTRPLRESMRHEF